MAVSIKIDGITQDIQVLIRDTLSPEAQAVLFQQGARQMIDQAAVDNAAILGAPSPYAVEVDGSASTPIAAATIASEIVARFDLQGGVVDWIWSQILQAAPIVSGRYRQSIQLFADGELVTAPDPARHADEWLILATVPYARKIEGGGQRRPQSPQAPNGVFEVVATMAQRRFSNLAAIKFTYIGSYSGTAVSAWAATKTASQAGLHAGKRAFNHRRQFDKNIRNPAILIRPRFQRL